MELKVCSWLPMSCSQLNGFQGGYGRGWCLIRSQDLAPIGARMQEVVNKAGEFYLRDLVDKQAFFVEVKKKPQEEEDDDEEDDVNDDESVDPAEQKDQQDE